MWGFPRNGELLYATGTRGLTVVELLPRSQTVAQQMMAGSEIVKSWLVEMDSCVDNPEA